MSDNGAVPELIVTLPGPDSKGYLRRLKRYGEVNGVIQKVFPQTEEALLDPDFQKNNPPDPVLVIQMVDQIVAFISDYAEMSDGSSPSEALLDMSQNELRELFNQFGEGSGPPLPEPLPQETAET